MRHIRAKIHAASEGELRRLEKEIGFFVSARASVHADDNSVSVYARFSDEQVQFAEAHRSVRLSDVVDMNEAYSRSVDDDLFEWRSHGVAPEPGAAGPLSSFWDSLSSLATIRTLAGRLSSQVSNQYCFVRDLPNLGSGLNPKDNLPLPLIGMGKPLSSNKPSVLILGGVHGDEVIPPEVVIKLPFDYAAALNGKDLTYGRVTFQARAIQKMLHQLDVFFVPVVNPAGRAFTLKSRTFDDLKGRRNGNGVDINRNFDFLWNYRQYFSSKASPAISDDPSQNTYKGPKPHSEPETGNIVWCLDSYPKLCALIDLHSGTQEPGIWHNWGDDHIGSDPRQRFTEMFNKRCMGLKEDSYNEWMQKSDFERIVKFASSAAKGANRAMNGTDTGIWSAGASFDKWSATCASTDDYAFSRHAVNSRLGRVYGFTFEIGPDQTETGAELKARVQHSSAAVTACLIEIGNELGYTGA